jgi:hypothetical protein
VDADDYFSITKKLKTSLVNTGSTYIVNLTGGNKIIMLASFNFFKEIGCSEIFYKSFEGNTFYNLINQNSKHYECNKLNINAYLTSYGLQFSCSAPKYEASVSSRIFNYYRNIQFNRYSFLNSHWFTKGVYQENYLTGGWFEEYLYYYLTSNFKLNTENILFQTKLITDLKPETPALEFDIMFLLGDRLIIIEAKSNIQNLSANAQSPIGQMIYKLGAVKQLFGLKVSPYLITLADFHHLKKNQMDSLQEKMELVNIKVINRDHFLKIEDLKNFINY